MRSVLCNLAVLVGAGLCVWGLYLVAPWLCLVASGSVVATLGVLLAPDGGGDAR